MIEKVATMRPPRQPTKKARPPMSAGEILTNAQEAPSYQQEKYLKIMTHCFEEVDEEQFTTQFNEGIVRILFKPLTNVHAKKMITFVAQFITIKLKEEDEKNSETVGPFLSAVFEKILMLIRLDDKNLRFNSCSLLNQILKEAASQGISLDDEICNKITQIMISERICDKVVAIREEAVKVLQWLQDETNPTCCVTRTLLFHMSRDVSSEVRRSILSVIRVSSVSLPGIVQRIKDVKESIRMDAYKILADRRKMTSLTFATREKIIKWGLKDESESVRNTVETHLLPHWLEQLEGGLLQFVRELDVETHPMVPKMVLPHLFKTKTIKELLTPLQPPAGEKFIPMEQLDPSLALYWSCLSRYLAQKTEEEEEEEKEQALEALESLLATTTELCTYVGMVFDAPLPPVGSGEQQEAIEERRVSILIFLLELFDSCDLSDESGRKCLNQLLERILSSSESNQRLLECVTRQLMLGYTDPIQRVNVVLGIVDELHKPLRPVENEEPQPQVMSEVARREHQVKIARLRVALCNLQMEQEKAIDKQDFLKAATLKEQISEKREEMEQLDDEINQQPPPEVEMVREEEWSTPVLIKCLAIVLQLMRDKEVFKASIGLADFVENFVQKCIAVDNPHVMTMAIEINGIYCLQRLPNAKAYFPMFYVLLNNELRPYDEVRAVCIKCICANIVHHGFQALNIPANEAVFAPEKSRLNTSVRPELSYISNITILLDDPVIAVRNQAAIGLCKLLLSGRLNSPLLLSRLILLWFNPANGSNKMLMRVLGMFFSVYPSHHSEAPRHLTAALLPTLDLLLEAPHFSPLLDIDPKDIGLFILDLARPGRNKYYTANAHDAMAQILLERVLDEPAGDAVSLFLRLCINLQISLDDDAVRLPLFSLAKRIKKAHDGPKSKDMNKLLDMLRGQDDPSSQDSQLMSQDSQESSDGKENEAPQFRYGILGESEPMEWEHEETTPRPPRRSRQHSIPLGSTPRPLRRRRQLSFQSDTDSD